MEENLMEQATQPNEGEQTSTEPEQQGSTDQAQEQQQDQQEQEEVKAPDGAPEKYELKAPEGEEFDSSFLECIVTGKQGSTDQAKTAQVRLSAHTIPGTRPRLNQIQHNRIRVRVRRGNN